MKRILRRVLVLLAAVAAAGAVIAALLPRPIEAESARVSRGPLRVTVDEEGETRCRRRFVVASPVAGRLERPRIDEGQVVEAGRLLARVFPASMDTREEAEAAARLDSARAALGEADSLEAAAGIGAEQALRSLARAEELVEHGLISREAHELAVAARRSADEAMRAAAKRVERARAEVREAEAALIASRAGGPAAPVEIRAPAAGVVLRVIEESERTIPAGAPVVELGDPAELEAVVDVLTSDAVAIRPGMAVELGGWGGAAVPGRVRSVEPAAFTKLSALGVEEQRVNVLVDVLGAPGALGVAYRVRASVLVWEGPNTLRVPLGALFRAGTGWSVFAVEGGRAREVSVELGRRGATDAEVLAGLDEGQEILLHPPDGLTDGAKVRARGEAR